MKQFFLYLSFIAIILLSACDDDNDCMDTACYSEPESFKFEFVDISTGENLIENGAIGFDDISVLVTTTADSSYIIYSIMTIAQYNNIFVVSGIGEQTEQVNCVIKICDEEVLHLFVDAERLAEDCCSWTHFNEITIENTDYESIKGYDIYTIKIDSFCP
ncbi:hypothetical protein [Draconibacterium halophilum]|uniref:Uncharacterized protein n=1 Tax=Draconibacterium halophilum TaxID=2706887 RepID=A0A6C0RHF9_9BACT|nr:hypothetical protein [Draconibacterium halophilum]QIA09436.1 hypothetical protein G0Q07_17750 [Draconibacterium halophilum]